MIFDLALLYSLKTNYLRMIYYRCSHDKAHIFANHPFDGFCPHCQHLHNESHHLIRVLVAEDVWKAGFFEEKSKSLIELDKSGLKLQSSASHFAQLSEDELGHYVSERKRIFKELDLLYIQHLYYSPLESDEAYELRLMLGEYADQFVLNPPPINAHPSSVLKCIEVVNERTFFANNKQIKIGNNGIVAGQLTGNVSILTPLGEKNVVIPNGLMVWEAVGSYTAKGGKVFPNKAYYTVSSLNLVRVKKGGATFRMVPDGVAEKIDPKSEFYKSFIPEQIKNLEFNYNLLRSKMARTHDTFALIGNTGLNIQIRKQGIEKNIAIDEQLEDDIVNFSINKRKLPSVNGLYQKEIKPNADFKGTKVELLEEGNVVKVTRGKDSIQVSI